MTRTATVLAAALLWTSSAHAQIKPGPAAALPQPTGDRVDKRELVRQARAAYYSARRGGFESFEVNLQVNWDTVLGPAKPGDTQREAGMRLLKGLHFSAAMDAEGKTSVTHRADTPATNAQVQSGYDQIFTGMDQVISGFYATYTPLMITSPFPDVNYDYTVEDAAYGYRMAWKENGTSEITVRMAKNFAILEMIVNAPEFDSSIRPAFTTIDGLYVLTAYDGDYRPTATKTGVVKLTAQVDHVVINGLRVVGHLFMKSSVDDAGSQTELTFTDYTVRKR